MNASDLKAKSAEQLQEQLIELRKTQFNQRMQQASGQLTATHEIRITRRDIARVKTIINQKKAEA